MKTVDRAKYTNFLKKGEQHQRSGIEALKNKDYDAAVTNFSIALINYLDALSVNRFGKDLSSDNHESAPPTLNNRLKPIGISDFNLMATDCSEVLKLKNVASYRGINLTQKEAFKASKVIEKVKIYVKSKLDPSV
jgi:hypothetical protein